MPAGRPTKMNDLKKIREILNKVPYIQGRKPLSENFNGKIEITIKNNLAIGYEVINDGTTD